MNDKLSDITPILETSMNKLKANNKKAYDLIIRKSKERFFETHQTQGNLNKFAKEIFDVFYKKEKDHES